MYDPLNVYRGRYREFIDNIIEKRPLNEMQEFNQDHHIVPRTTFKDRNDPRIEDEDNHINLTLREHFIAHRILAEDNPQIKGLAYAYWRMCNGNMKVATPEEYEDARIRFLKVHSGESHPLYGKSPSQSTKEKLSIALKGELNGFYGKSHSKETKRLLSYVAKNPTEETRRRRSEGQRGNKNHLGCKHSEETRKKLSERAKNRVYHNICRFCTREFEGHSWNDSICPSCRGGL